MLNKTYSSRPHCVSCWTTYIYIYIYTYIYYKIIRGPYNVILLLYRFLVKAKLWSLRRTLPGILYFFVVNLNKKNKNYIGTENLSLLNQMPPFEHHKHDHPQVTYIHQVSSRVYIPFQYSRAKLCCLS